MSVRNLYLIRHAEVDQQYRFRYLGRNNVPLSSEGILQARELGKDCVSQGDLLRDDLWVGLSPLNRCLQTWEEMRIPLKSQPVILPELMEVDFGDWEGKSFSEITQRWPKEVSRWSKFQSDFRFPGGEGLDEFQDRIQSLRETILRRSERNGVLVSHGGVIASLLCLILGLPPSQYLAFELARPSLAKVTLFENGMGRLAGLRTVSAVLSRKAGEWPG